MRSIQRLSKHFLIAEPPLLPILQFPKDIPYWGGEWQRSAPSRHILSNGSPVSKYEFQEETEMLHMGSNCYLGDQDTDAVLCWILTAIIMMVSDQESLINQKWIENML